MLRTSLLFYGSWCFYYVLVLQRGWSVATMALRCDRSKERAPRQAPHSRCTRVHSQQHLASSLVLSIYLPIPLIRSIPFRSPTFLLELKMTGVRCLKSKICFRSFGPVQEAQTSPLDHDSGRTFSSGMAVGSTRSTYMMPVDFTCNARRLPTTRA